MKLKDKVVIITGATSGIGEACAFVFGAEGAKILITGRSQVKLDNVLHKLHNQGIEAIGVLANAASLEDNQRMAEEAIKHLGRIDILVNNAGFPAGTFEDLNLETFRQSWIPIFGVRCTLLNTAFTDFEKKGSIVGIFHQWMGTPARAAYTANKYAMNGF